LEATKLNAEPFKLTTGADTVPTKKFVELILGQAIWNKTDKLIFRLGEQFEITAVIGEREEKFAPAPSSLYEPIIRVLLAASEIQYWTKGEVSAPFETVNPVSRWTLESKDLSRSLVLRRVRSA